VATLPEVPAIGEIVHRYDASGWLGIGAPKGTTSDVVDLLNNKTDKVPAGVDVQDRLRRLGVEPMSSTPAESLVG
jgi:tripartite-type tricarboxylate transporter receptor subunit TctC